MLRRRYLRKPAGGGISAPPQAAGGITTPGGHPAVVGTGGGVGIRPSPKPSSTIPKPINVGGFTQPPFMTYSPAIEAERRAVQRGLEDKIRDVHTERHFNQTDLAQALRDIRTTTQRNRGKINRESSRSREDIGRESSRGQQDLTEREEGDKLSATRANEDFDTQLATIGRQFAQLGQRQSEGANASGVLDSGTQAASAAARGQNQSLAEAPIAIARARVNEDLATALRQIGVKRGELSADTESSLKRLLEDQERGIGQLTQDRNRDRKLSHRETGRKEFGLTREAQRARREAALSNISLIEQEIYEARNNRPGAFARTGAKKGRRR